MACGFCCARYPGRRWDPADRAWCIPVEPEQAEALARLFSALPGEPDVSAQLEHVIARRRSRRRLSECFVDLARPDSDWWLSFATDAAAEPVAALLAHPDARDMPAIGRALVPLDDESVATLTELGDGEGEVLRLSDPLRRALRARSGEVQEREVAIGEARRDETQTTPGGELAGHEVQFRRDRSGEHWIVVAGPRARHAGVMAARAGLRTAQAAGGAVGIAAIEHDAEQIDEVLAEIEAVDVDPRVRAWITRARTWRGHIEVQGPGAGEEPVFLLLGDFHRLPGGTARASRQRAGGSQRPADARELAADRGASRGLDEPRRTALRERPQGGAPGSARGARALGPPRRRPPSCSRRATSRSCSRSSPELRGALRAEPGRGSVHEHARLPSIRADPFCVPELDRFLAGSSVWLEPEALSLLQEIREEHARSAGLVELSSATEGELHVPGLAGELKPFQRAGVSYLLEQRRAFLADEQGLGKTIEALAALEADGAYPAVVVCPASLKLNWLREIERWLPGRSARALSGTGASRPDSEADITVVNYDIVAARLDELTRPSAAGRWCSTSPTTARTPQPSARRRCSAWPPRCPRTGIILALTGTPVVNRPAELISQLRILGRLQDFGSGVKFGERFRGPDAHLRLHWHLRARCFVRRLKADVLPQLPAKTRSVVPVELDNAAEYRLAERDLIAWLRSQPLELGELDAKVAAALRAERLVRLNALKLLAARGKLHAALTWIHDFCSSGERLVVFAHHREVQRAIIDRFPMALHIVGADSHAARDQAVSAFQQPDTPENQLIVCSIEVAGQGLTLTRSSSVLFLELDWTPAKHDQAEDRCHRIGQVDAVNAYYLLAADTVDEAISVLLERKRAVIGAVTDGQPEDEESVVDALVRELRGEPYRHLRAVA